MAIGSHQSAASSSVDWLTPPEWIAALGLFNLDPCCPPHMPWPTASVMWSLPFDGLTHEWTGRVWCNPPYGGPKVIEPWMRKMAAHGNGIALIFARTETRCWFEHVWRKADAVLFVKGRPRFYRPDGHRAPANCGGPVALVAYGEFNARVLRNVSHGAIPGAFVDLRG